MTNAYAQLAALADPTRRTVFERLRNGESSVGELSRGLPVTRPAVSQHLRVLKDAGLVTDRTEGTRRVYRIDPHGLATIRMWLDGFWEVALESYAHEVAKTGDEADEP